LASLFHSAAALQLGAVEASSLYSVVIVDCVSERSGSYVQFLDPSFTGVGLAWTSKCVRGGKMTDVSVCQLRREHEAFPFGEALNPGPDLHIYLVILQV
jgi:hypothetical protein